MNEQPERPPFSLWNFLAVITAFATFFYATISPFAITLPVVFAGSALLPYRFERDANSIWGLRLLIYATLAVLGRPQAGMPAYFVDVQAFTTAGLIAGGEVILQSFRKPPAGAKFDPWIVSLTGIIFLIACNSAREYIWVLAPTYVALTLLSLNDLHPRAESKDFLTGSRRIISILLAVLIGTGVHQVLWVYRGSLMALSARFVSSQANSAPQTAGVSDNPQLSSSFNAGSSTARMLRIEGSLNEPRLRAASFDIYSNGTWGPAISQRFSATKPLEAALPKETREDDASGHTRDRSTTDAKITVLRDSGTVLFAPLNSWGLMAAPGDSFDWDRYQGPFTSTEPPPISYYVFNSRKELGNTPGGLGGIQSEQGPLCVEPTGDRLDRLKTVPPEIDPRVDDLAKRITSTGKTEGEKAAQIIKYLMTNNKYSLEFQRSAQDPVSDFVLNKRAAHCQYFASAAVMMLRAIGIPARYATGYYAHEQADDGATVVRGRDAHAWTEAYLKGVGWVTLDATPGGGRADEAVSPSPWYEKTLEKLQDNFARLRAWFGNLTQVQILGIVVGVLTLWGLERARQAWKKRRRSVVGPKVPPHLVPVARRFERLMTKRGVKLESGRPWSESLPEELGQEREWIDDYNRARFDDETTIDIDELERELKRLEKEVTTKQ